MNIKDIKKGAKEPQLYKKGTASMWTDPHISKQLLELHINHEHDVASRSSAKIEHISNHILEWSGKPKMKILDLGCGPGLYAEYLTQKGHAVTGVDFSENSIRYAMEEAQKKHLDIEYLNMNYLELDFEDQFDLVIMIYLDFCALIPEERNKVLELIHKALKKGGLFICDVVNEKNLDKKIIPQFWEVQESGFWEPHPYIAMAQGFKSIKNHENVLPEGEDCWNGENVTFYVSQKE